MVQPTFTVRMPRELRDDFIAACWRNDRTAAQVIRQFVRQYSARNGEGAQAAYDSLARASQKIVDDR